MRFLSVRELRAKAAKVWKELPEEKEMVVTSNGRPVAILASVDEESVEESLKAFRQARAIVAVASLQRASARRGTRRMTIGEIEEEIREVRARRSR